MKSGEVFCEAGNNNEGAECAMLRPVFVVRKASLSPGVVRLLTPSCSLSLEPKQMWN